MRAFRDGLLAMLALALVLTASNGLASSPALNAIQPPGGPRGSELELTLTGARLNDAEELLWYQPGIETLELETIEDEDDAIKARIRIAPDARLGLYDVRVRTATGISHLRTFSVGAFPEVAEEEPNDDIENPQAIPLNVTVTGVAENEDVDYFVVEAKQGERLTAEVEGIRLGNTLFDPYIAIHNEAHEELATSDDATLVYQDGIVSIVVPEDGKYIIEVRESAYRGNGNCHYRLHVGNFPRPRAIVPAGGPLGETIEVRWIGDVTGEKTTTVTLPQEPDPTFGLLAEDEHGVAPAPNPFRLSPFGNVLEVEPNNSRDEATPGTPPVAFNGVIEDEGDIDYFSFEAKEGQRFDINVYARALRSPLDSVIVVAKKEGGNIESNDDNGNNPDSYLRFEAPEDGEYVVSIRDHLNRGGPDYFYRIEVVPVEPKLRISPQNENRQIGVVTVSVPRGSRQALLVNARRADFGGPVNLSAENLPEGMTLEADTMDPSISTMPIVFQAAEDAQIRGTLAWLTGALEDSSTEITSTFDHTVELVQGRNNVPFWTRRVERLAVAVTEEAPYTIEVVEPKAPLVRGGSMQLKVVAHRAEGFDAPISVSLPWNPPGIGSSRSIRIQEGETEALIPLNANGNAPAETWKIVVNGTSNGPGGPILVSSQLTPLTVTEQFLAFDYTSATVEQGKETSIAVQIQQLKEFDGEATVKLIGLPNEATTEDLTITKDTNEIRFPIQTTENTPPGRHKNLFCEVVILQDGEPVLHKLGSGQIRVDKPLPAEEEPAEVAQAVEAEEKPLSRLEQLRQEAARRASSGPSGQDEPGESER